MAGAVADPRRPIRLERPPLVQSEAFGPVVSLIARIYAFLLHLCGLIAGVIVGAIAVLITGEVVMRNLSGRTVPWLLEASEYGLFIAAFLGAPWVLRLGGHVRVDVLLNVASTTGRRWTELAGDILAAAVCAILCFFGTAAVIDSAGAGMMIYKSIIIPEWWVLAFVPLSFLLLTVEFVRRAVRAARGLTDDADEMIQRGL